MGTLSRLDIVLRMAVLDNYVPQKVELLKGTIRSNLTLGMEKSCCRTRTPGRHRNCPGQGLCQWEKDSQLDAEVQAGGRISQVGKNNVYRLPEQFTIKLLFSSSMMQCPPVHLLSQSSEGCSEKKHKWFSLDFQRTFNA